MWTIDHLEINGGFLPGLKLALPRGLTCIIGPRGSGKSTLAEALRFAINGTASTSKQRTELLQANLGSSGLVTLVANAQAGAIYTIKRAYKQPAVLLSADGRTVPNVDLERGTFLPLDAYNGPEIEAIADEVLGDKRRALLDDLRTNDLYRIHLSLGEHGRALEGNADRIRAVRREIDNLTERIEEFGDIRAKLSASTPLADNQPSAEFTRATKQQQYNARERRKIDNVAGLFTSLRNELIGIKTRTNDQSSLEIVEKGSSNTELLSKREAELRQSISALSSGVDRLIEVVEGTSRLIQATRTEVSGAHSKQANDLAELQKLHEAADEMYRVRADLEQQVARLEEIEADSSAKKAELATLLESRKSLKAMFLLEREEISGLRDAVAKDLQKETGEKVRIRVLRHADDLAYRTILNEALKGARVRNHEDIVASLLRLRPEQLAQFIQTNDAGPFDEECGFGPERARRILDAFRENIDPLELEVVEIEDQIRIELNVSTSDEAIFRDAAELSRGQKCTALLPLLLARRDTPLIIDQPEDNLDNHFIYQTVVNAIQRMKPRRQMIFITHNANIPVLAEADLVVVMNSDGKIGYVEKYGTVDQCRDQIVDLLEGGREAFERRRQRYGRT